MNIRTEYWAKPIPNRNFGWIAFDDDTYDGPGCKIGEGSTERAAINDLLEQLGIEPILYWFNVETKQLLEKTK